MVRKCLVKNANERVKTASDLIAILNDKENISRQKESVDLNATQVLDRSSFLADEIKNDLNNLRQSDNETSRIQRPGSEPVKKEIILDNIIPSIEQAPPIEKIDINKGPKYQPEKKETIAGSVEGISSGKYYFQQKDYITSYKYLNKFKNTTDFDTEAKFYLGFMLYNGKCGGAHDFDSGKAMMDEAKSEDRPLVMDLVLKYVLGKK